MRFMTVIWKDVAEAVANWLDRQGVSTSVQGRRGRWTVTSDTASDALWEQAKRFAGDEIEEKHPVKGGAA